MTATKNLRFGAFLVACVAGWVLFSCGKDSDDAGDSEKDDTEQVQTGEAGTLQIGSSNLKALVAASNEELADDGEEIALNSEFQSTLPSGSVTVSTDLTALAESVLNKFSWYIRRVEISTDAKNWVQVYNGDAKEFDLIAGTSAADAISNSSIPAGAYKYLVMEIENIVWGRAGAECEDGEMNFFGIGLLTTREEAKTYHGGKDVFDMLINPGDYAEVQQAIDDNNNNIEGVADYVGSLIETSPKDLLQSAGYDETDGFEYDEMYWYMHQPITITEGRSTNLVVTVSPEDDFGKAGPCDEAPGKPQFLVGEESEIVSAFIYRASRRSI